MILTRHSLIDQRYASLYFIVGVNKSDNELIALETMHLYCVALDRYFGNVCELDIIFNFDKAYQVMDEMFLSGELQETSVTEVLRTLASQDETLVVEVMEEALLM